MMHANADLVSWWFTTRAYYRPTMLERGCYLGLSSREEFRLKAANLPFESLKRV